VYFEGAGEETIYIGSEATTGEEKKELVWCTTFFWLQNRIITKLMCCRMYSWPEIKSIALSAKN